MKKLIVAILLGSLCISSSYADCHAEYNADGMMPVDGMMPIDGMMPVDGDGFLVDVYWRMVRCASYNQDRCPQISIRMSAEVYDALGKPKGGSYSYRAEFTESSETYMLSDIFVYNPNLNDYELTRSGEPADTGVTFSLNEVCIRLGDEGMNNCMPVELRARGYAKDILHTKLFYSPVPTSIPTPALGSFFSRIYGYK